MRDSIISPWPSYTEEEIDKVSNILQSNKVNYWTGSEGGKFEKEFAEFAGSKYAIAVSNGTVALDLALHALNIGPGDEVIVTPRTFIASVSSIVNSGATPIFADVDLNTQNITPETVAQVLSDRTKAIVCVHLAGWPCEMDGFRLLAEKHGLKLIEDCAQAHGAKYKGRSVGSLGDIAAWSFCQDKIMTTGGEGGMVTTDDQGLWSKMWSFKDHGKSYDAVFNKEHLPGFRWVHETFGTNWRLTEIQAAIGRIQLRRMPKWIEQRTKNAEALRLAVEGITCVRAPKAPKDIIHAYYKFYMFVISENLAPGWSRDRIIAELNVCGVPALQGSCSEVYLEKAFDGTDFVPAVRLAQAKQLGEDSLMFMVHPTITREQIDHICGHLREVLTFACRS